MGVAYESYPLSVLPPRFGGVSVLGLTATVTVHGNEGDTARVRYGDGVTSVVTIDADGTATAIHPFDAPGTYTLEIETTQGAWRRLPDVTVSGGVADPVPGTIDHDLDPSDYTIAVVRAYVESLLPVDDPDVIAHVQTLLDRERAGLDRSTLVAWLDARLGAV